MSGVDVSVVLNAHREGLLAHHSVRSARRAIEEATTNGLRCELIAIVDAADAETRRYFERHAHWFDQLRHVDFRDLSQARNHGVERARGTWIAFLDADDLFSRRWLSLAHRCAALVDDPSIVFHPELNLNFGTQHHLYRHIDQRDASFSRFDLLESNCWSSLCFARRELLQRLPYQPIDLENGIGFEDWLWNCEVVAMGGEHRVVPGTAHFIRLKETLSLGRATWLQGATLGRTSLFAQAEWRAPLPRSIELPPLPAEEPLPAWFIDEWRAIHLIDPSMFPEARLIDGLRRYRNPRSRASVLFRALNAIWPDDATHVFFAPWLKHGGADLAARHHVDALVRLGVPAERIVFVTTENSDSPWLDRLPPGVTRIELGRMAAEFSEADQVLCLLRLLVQKRPRVLHNINSRLAYVLLKAHGRAIKKHTRIFASAYCFDFTPQGQMVGYAGDSVPEIFPILDAVFCDHQRFIDVLVRTFGLARETFRVARFPAPPIQPRPARATEDVLQVLWASRLDRQKRPDILLEVARRCRGLPMQFHVWGGAIGQPHVSPEVLQAEPNVRFYGAFDDFSALPHHRYDVMLYTSQWDGLPNILLEAIAAGIVCVAPAIAGIPELLTERSGWLVRDPEAVDDYVAALSSLATSSLEAMREAGYAELRAKHSLEGFHQALRDVPFYVAATDEERR